MSGAEKILVRATVHLPHLPLGREALVDPTGQYVAACLRRGLVVPVVIEPERRPDAQ